MKYFVLLFVLVAAPVSASNRFLLNFTQPRNVTSGTMEDDVAMELVERVFPDARYGHEDCSEDGRIAAVDFVINGRFVKGGGKQYVALLSASECGNAEEDVEYKQVLVVNDEIRSIADAIGNTPELVVDEDRDGLSEVVLSRFSNHQGYHWSTAQTYTYKSGRPREIDLVSGVVEKSECMHNTKGKSWASVFFITSTQPLTLRQVNYVSNCQDDPAKWVYDSEGTMEPF